MKMLMKMIKVICTPFLFSSDSQLDIHPWLSPEEYARMSGIPCLLAKHSLVLSENRGLTCRDESIEGLRFYSSALFFEEEDKMDDS
jgi:hypothetical protein